MTINLIYFWCFLLIFARVTALIVSAPVFGNRSIPHTAKVGLSALVSLALVPILSSRVSRPPDNLFSLLGQMGAETAVGLCLGFMVTLLFASLEIAGQFIDTQMGFGIMNILNPLSEHQSTPMGQVLYQLGITIFLVAGGHVYLIGTLAGSFDTISPGGAHLSGEMTKSFIDVVGHMFLIAFKIAAPAAAVLIIVDIAFGIIARTIPQMNVFIVGIPAKILVGLMTVSLVLPVIAMVIHDQLIPTIGGAGHAVLQAAR